MQIENPYMDSPCMILDQAPDPGWSYLKQHYFGSINTDPHECRMPQHGCYLLRWSTGAKVISVQVDEIRRLYELKTSMFMGLPIVSHFTTVNELVCALSRHLDEA